MKPGCRGRGVERRRNPEAFPLEGARSLYGATKLAAELMILEYAALYGVPAVVNRCGVICGPWQMGKVDQGFVGLWLARHVFGGRLSYIGYGGAGTQVRDLLHVADLCRLIDLQIGGRDRYAGKTYNVGGGRDISVSLLELTRQCQALTGTKIEIEQVAETPAADVPYYVTDSARVCAGPAGGRSARSPRRWPMSTNGWWTIAPRLHRSLLEGIDRMSVAIITGAAGLIGGQSVRFFADKGFDIAGVDNDMRRVFFGPDASTQWHRRELERTIKNYVHFDTDIRDREAMAKVFQRYGKDIAVVIHTAAQPSHDWAASDPVMDFTVNATARWCCSSLPGLTAPRHPSCSSAPTRSMAIRPTGCLWSSARRAGRSRRATPSLSMASTRP